MMISRRELLDTSIAQLQTLAAFLREQLSESADGSAVLETRACKEILNALSALIQAAAGTVFSLQAWANSDANFKLSMASAFIEAAADKRVILRRSPQYYVHELDELVKDTIDNGAVEGLNNSTGVAFKTIAMMDCDWEDGTDRFVWAQKYFGPVYWGKFKQLYPEKYERPGTGPRR